MKTFDHFGLAPHLLKAIAAMGFTTPTPVQAKVIPLLLQDQADVAALAQTGTGKTAAFGLPLLQLTDPQRKAPQALVLCPTRELCMQITSDLEKMAHQGPDIRVLAVYGGSSISNQIHALRRGIHILVATPGRIHDLLRRGSASLANVERVVLDEADEMLNMGFEEDLKAILTTVPDTARTLLFSATMSKQVAAIAGQYMEAPVEVVIGQRNSGADNVRHEYYVVAPQDRYRTLKRVIDACPGMYGIVFCRTRMETQEVAAELMGDGYNADALHGELSQAQRDRVMNAFRRRQLQLLVATDVAARGLDVNDLTHVINFTLPDDVENYTHRSGRTGRAGKGGISIAIIHAREEYKLRMIERMLKKRFERKTAPSQKQVCEAQIIHQVEILKSFNPTHPLLETFMPTVETMLAEFSREELLRRFMVGAVGRILEAYQAAPDVDIQPTAHPSRKKDTSEETHANGPSQRPARTIRLCVNLGHVNHITPPDLIALINQTPHGPSVRVGRIHIDKLSSLFEISGRGAHALMDDLNTIKVEGRRLRVNIVEGGGRDSYPARHRRATGKDHPYRSGNRHPPR